MLQVLLCCNIHLLIRSEHVSDKIEALSLQLLYVAEVKQTVVDQGQVEWSLHYGCREFHQIGDKMALDIKGCWHYQVLLIFSIEEHIEVSEDHLVDKRRQVKVVEIELNRFHEWSSDCLSHR